MEWPIRLLSGKIPLGFMRAVFLIMFLASACAPAASPARPQVAASAKPPTEGPSTATWLPFPSSALTATPWPVATSRGPSLEATDPTTVRLDSGGLQLVEFFSFT
jgi:hypothetical protein